MTIADMFDSSNAPARVNAPEVGFLVTNHLNLMYMLSAGLVMPPSGFGKKYYGDTLECFPGWIPLFTDKVSREAIEHSVREARHLRPCIVEVGLTGLSGRAMALGNAGPRELHFPDQCLETDRVLLFPAPLPVSRVVSIVFRTTDERRTCEADAGDYGNVPMAEFQAQNQQATFHQGVRFPLAARQRARGAVCTPAMSPRCWRGHGDAAALRQPEPAGRSRMPCRVRSRR